MIDQTSAWLGALFAVSVILALVVAGCAFAVWTCRDWIASLLRNFSGIQLKRSMGKIEVTSAFAEELPQAKPKLMLVRDTTGEVAPETAAAE